MDKPDRRSLSNHPDSSRPGGPLPPNGSVAQKFKQYVGHEQFATIAQRQQEHYNH